MHLGRYSIWEDLYDTHISQYKDGKKTDLKKYPLGKLTSPDAQPLNPRSSKFLVFVSETHTSMLVDGENIEAVRVPVD
jgi:hypothetical protein